MFGIIDLHEIVDIGVTKKIKSFRYDNFKDAEKEFDEYLRLYNCARIKNEFTHVIEIYEKENRKKKLRAIINVQKSVVKYIYKKYKLDI